MRKIAVLGSINIDYFVKLEEFPQIGETITAQQLDLLYGGKGANQAVSAGKLNGDVTFFGSVGDDAIGDDILANFKEHGIKTKYVQRVSNVNTGSAFVLSNSEDNQIIVIEGANKYTNIEYVESHLEQILEHDIFLLQFEIPMETIEFIVPILAENDKTIIIDPAPAQRLPRDIFEKCTFILPNEHEARFLFEENLSLEEHLEENPNKIIVTKGEEGVYYHNGKEIIHIPSIKTKVIDTTGAGDSFAGAFALGISEGLSIASSIHLGMKAASFAISHQGAQTGMPNRSDLGLKDGSYNYEGKI